MHISMVLHPLKFTSTLFFYYEYIKHKKNRVASMDLSAVRLNLDIDIIILYLQSKLIPLGTFQYTYEMF